MNISPATTTQTYLASIDMKRAKSIAQTVRVTNHMLLWFAPFVIATVSLYMILTYSNPGLTMPVWVPLMITTAFPLGAVVVIVNDFFSRKTVPISQIDGLADIILNEGGPVSKLLQEGEYVSDPHKAICAKLRTIFITFKNTEISLLVQNKTLRWPHSQPLVITTIEGKIVAYRQSVKD